MKTLERELIRITHCEPGREPLAMVFESESHAIDWLRARIAERQIDISEFYMELGTERDRCEAELLHDAMRFGDQAEFEQACNSLQALRERIAERHASNLAALIPLALGGIPEYPYWRVEKIDWTLRASWTECGGLENFAEFRSAAKAAKWLAEWAAGGQTERDTLRLERRPAPNMPA
jgi:hypothetical protein